MLLKMKYDEPKKNNKRYRGQMPRHAALYDWIINKIIYTEYTKILVYVVHYQIIKFD